MNPLKLSTEQYSAAYQRMTDLTVGLHEVEEVVGEVSTVGRELLTEAQS